ncbi:uncharacterized protein SCDLUD_002475 [Saccharomycodes ludwigii]|uniref:uncharacterized protein n=1 Tax=Saccharomycodes ludwigii TaxID=36035 RepID=UPI001E8AEBBE|nr:hypothetical protein SCDLUD_002475 [Saccharomycodes ludwigii]KAH3901010.1 hypothetical protein SCDLUD_002475 [Saccharomycodes ludwigii]
MPTKLPKNYTQDDINQLSKELLIAGGIGALKGALFSVTTAILMRKYSMVYKNVRMPVRLLYHTTCIGSASVYYAEQQLLRYEDKRTQLELKRRRKILDEAAERGIFLEDDGGVAQN